MLQKNTRVALAALTLACGQVLLQTSALAVEAPVAERPVIVELFTSQGCSSCPPADQILAKITAWSEKHELPVYCLSYHVDYWNSLGWEDPYSSEEFSQRQRSYAAAFESSRVYTPQMIVGGASEFVGSSGQKAEAAIQDALATKAAHSVTLNTAMSEDKRSAHIEYVVEGDVSGVVLNIALVQNEASNKVPRGENAGESLVHVQVVRSLQIFSLDKPSGKATIEIPAGLEADDSRVVVYVQYPESMHISGAAAAELRAR
ncbi:MAG: DUF1223 domain-containing protein [Aeoliella sp.]